jgi:putative phage-type endonuclease
MSLRSFGFIDDEDPVDPSGIICRPRTPGAVQVCIGSDADVERLLSVTESEAHRIAHLPQDVTLADGTVVKNPEWLAARRPHGIARFTGSALAALIGYNPYSTAKKAVGELINPTFSGNAFTKWGSEHEDHACDKFVEWSRLEHPDKTYVVNHYGLMIHPTTPWLAYSPDGDVEIRDGATGCVTDRALLEIKCPGSSKYKSKSASIDPIYGIHKWPNGEEGPCPVYYWFQIQLGCHIFERKYCLFVIWIPAQTQVFNIDFDEDYFVSKTLPAARKSYWENYIPELRRSQSIAWNAWTAWDSTVVPRDNLPPALVDALAGAAPPTSKFPVAVVLTDASRGDYKCGVIAIVDSDWGGADGVDRSSGGARRGFLATSTEYHCPLKRSDPVSRALACDDSQDGPTKKWSICLYAERARRVHYMGEWLLSHFEDRVPGRSGGVQSDPPTDDDDDVAQAVLVRAIDQKGVVGVYGNDPMSEDFFTADITLLVKDGERARETVIREALGRAFMVEQGPRFSVTTLSDAVAGGEEKNTVRDHTVDFVAWDGTGRVVYFESKTSMKQVDEACREKCRALRDIAKHRVFVLVDGGGDGGGDGDGDGDVAGKPSPFFYDFGCPGGTAVEQRLSAEEFAVFVSSDARARPTKKKKI